MRILIISPQSVFRQQVQAACLRAAGDNAISLRTAESMGQGMELALQLESQLIFLDLTKNLEAGMLTLEQLSLVSNRVVAISIDKMGTEVITRAIRTGAREILPQPVQEEEVQAIYQKAKTLGNEEATIQPARTGKSVMCFSSKGGVGKTTLSCNIAVALRQKFGPDSVALIDGNTQAPNIAPMLDLRPQRWLKDAVAEYKRLDSQLLSEFMTIHPSSGLHVLAHSSNDPLGIDFSEDQLSKILLVSKGTYPWTIVDTFPLLSSLNLSLMDLCDEILLVTEAVVPALRSAKYNLDTLKKAGYGENRIRVVLNRYTQFQGNVSLELSAEALGWAIDTVIPYDMHATIATNSGKPLIEMYPERKVSEAIQALTGLISNTAPPEIKTENSIEINLRRLKNWLDI